MKNYLKVPCAYGDRYSQRKNGTLRCNAGLEWHGCHGISDTEASALAPAVGEPSKSAGCLATQKNKKKKPSLASTRYHVFAESQYHSTMRSDPDAKPEKSPSTIVRRGGNSHVTSRSVSFPPHPIPEGMLSRSIGMPSRKEGPPSIWDTHGLSGNVFANPVASSSAPYPQELTPWSPRTEEPLHSFAVEKGERQTQDQDLRCQSGPSAKDSVILSGGDSSKNYGVDQERLQISDLHFAGKQVSRPRVCTCSQFHTEAMQWIKEVELVDSVDELKTSSSIRGISMPNFEVLDARTASALNKFIHNSHFNRRISLEEQKAQKQDRFLRGRQVADLIYEYFRVTGTNDSVENYADLFTNALRNDDIQEFDSKWDGILLSMTKIPPDDILEGLHKLRIRESGKLKTVLELYDLEIHQKNST